MEVLVVVLPPYNNQWKVCNQDPSVNRFRSSNNNQTSYFKPLLLWESHTLFFTSKVHLRTMAMTYFSIAIPQIQIYKTFFHKFQWPGLYWQKPTIAAFQPPMVCRSRARKKPSWGCKQRKLSYVHFIENRPLQNHYMSHAITLLKLCPFKTRNG